MYLIDSETNVISSEVPPKTFHELKVHERAHLQKWIISKPDVLGEELLIIQEEFDGFNDTKERLDLLALDKEGNIVVIENKRDDSGRDITWQALKYVSYCSTLKKDQIRAIYQDYLVKSRSKLMAEESLMEFFDEVEYEELVLNKRQTQRIMMVSGNYRKEVTSTVLWLMEYKVRIQCFKATLHELRGQLLLDIEQIIPTPDTADYIIKMADKTQEEISQKTGVFGIQKIRQEFWTQFLQRMVGAAPIYQDISPSRDHWLSSGKTGVSGVYYSCIAGEKYVGVEMNIATPDKEKNEEYFRQLESQKEDIEKSFGQPLEWHLKPEAKRSQVKYWVGNVNIKDREDWSKMLDFLTEYSVKFEAALRKPIKRLKSLK